MLRSALAGRSPINRQFRRSIPVKPHYISELLAADSALPRREQNPPQHLRSLSSSAGERCGPDGCPADGINGWAVNTLAGVVIGVTAALCFGPALLVMCFLQRLCCFSSGGCVDRCIVRFIGNSEEYADAIDGDSPGIRSSQVGSLLDNQMRPERPTSAQLRGRLSIAQAVHAAGKPGVGTPPSQPSLSRAASFGSGRFTSVADIIRHAQQVADGIAAKEASGRHSASPPPKQQAIPPAAANKRRTGSISVPSPLLALSQITKHDDSGDAGGIEMVAGPSSSKPPRQGSGEVIGTPGLDAPSVLTRPNSSSLPKDVVAEETAPSGGIVTVSPLQAFRVSPPSPPSAADSKADSKHVRPAGVSTTSVSLVAPPSTLSPRHSRGLLAQLHRTGSTRFFADAPVKPAGQVWDSKQSRSVQPWDGDDASSLATSDVRTGTNEEADSVSGLDSPTSPAGRQSPREQGKLGALPRLSVLPGDIGTIPAEKGSVFSLLRGPDTWSVGGGSDGPIKRKQRASLVLAGGSASKGHMSALQQGGFITANPLRQASAGVASRQRRRSAILAAASAGSGSSTWNAARRGSASSSGSPKHRRHSSTVTGMGSAARKAGRDVSLSDADIGAKPVAFPDEGGMSGSDSDGLERAGAQAVFLGLSPPQRGLGGHSPDQSTLSLGERQGSADDTSSAGAGAGGAEQVPAQRKRSNSLGASNAASIQRHIGLPPVLSLSRRASAGELYSLEAIPEASGRPLSGDSRVTRQATAGLAQQSTPASGENTPSTFDDDRGSWL